LSGRAVHISELERKIPPDQRRWAQIRSELGISAFGINAWTAENPGDVAINEHDEEGGDQELYFVVTGHAVFTIGDDEVDAPAGTFVFVQPSATRKAVAKAAETTVVAVGGTAGKAFEVRNWERSAHALAHWETEDWEAAIADFSRLHEEEPKNALFLYNLACAESRAGRADAALDHLRRAAELEARFGELARTDDDFDPIRDDPRFASVVAGQADAGGAST
jgi:tetratricopeptide (TPR) repeat protein